MRPLSPFENMLFKLGPARPIALAALDRPPDAIAAIAGFVAAQRRLPRLRQRIIRRFGWTFRAGTPPRPRDHIAIIDDAGYDAGDGAQLLLQKLDRAGFSPDAPPWRALIVNPAGAANGGSAVVFHCDHTIADGIRIVRMMRRMSHWAAADPQSFDIARGILAALPRLSLAAFLATPDDPAAPLRRLAAVSLPADLARRSRQGRNAGACLLAAMGEALAAPGGLHSGVALNGGAIEVVGERRSGADSGNFVAARAVVWRQAGETPDTGRSTAFRRLVGRRTWRIAAAGFLPGFLLRSFVGWTYRRFDLFMALIPSTGGAMIIGGAAARQFFGVSPWVADMKASMTAVQLNGAFCMVLSTGSGAAIAPAELGVRMAEALSRAAPVVEGPPEGEPGRGVVTALAP